MDKLRVGILGLRRGLVHLRSFLALKNVQVVGVCDRLETRRAQAASLIDGRETQLLTEFDDLLDLRPDAVVLASNGKQQAEQACQALEAGCHVLSEVPGAYHENDILRLRSVVERTGLTYMLAENTCYWDFLRYWRKWIVENRFGAISMAEGEYVHNLPGSVALPDGTRKRPTELRDHAGTKPVWLADLPPIQYLTHDLGPLLELLDDRVVSVSCRNGPYRFPDAPLRPDGQFALLETAKGTMIRILVSFNTYRRPEHRYRLFGIDGAVEWFEYEGFCRRMDRRRPLPQGWERIAIGRSADPGDARYAHGGADRKVARHFVRTILNGLPSPIDVYRMSDYALPGIVANRSAQVGGVVMPVPDLRFRPYEGTRFWESVGLPDAEPQSLADDGPTLSTSAVVP